MKRVFPWALVLLAGALGCSAKKPVDVRYIGCQVTNTWIDEHGNERKDCECRQGKLIATHNAATGKTDYVVRCN